MNTNRIIPLKWDSAFFGFPIGRVYARGLSAGALESELKKAGAKRIGFVELFCDVSDLKSVRAAERAGFRLADLKCHLRKPLRGPMPARPDWPGGLSFEKVPGTDIGRLKQVETGLFRESRYYRYPGFDKSKVDLMFRRWLENAVLARYDDECFVLSRGGRIRAFCTMRSPGKTLASIGLFGINRSSQGRGLGRLLLERVSSLLFARGIKELDVVTPGKNSRALLFYQKSGFILDGLTLVYYKGPG